MPFGNLNPFAGIDASTALNVVAAMGPASASNNGFLLATDWIIFNAKEPAITKLSAFNKAFGILADTVAEGNDSRILNGQTAYGWGNHAGLYSLAAHNHSLDSLSNVTVSANSSGEILLWNGSAWVNNTLAEAGIFKLDQTSPQSVINGAPTFAAGLKSTGDITFNVGANRTISICAQTLANQGQSLSVKAGAGFGSPGYGGQLSLFGGDSATGGTGARVLLGGGGTGIGQADIIAGTGADVYVRGADNSALPGNNTGGNIYLIGGSNSGTSKPGAVNIMSRVNSSVYASLDTLAIQSDRIFSFPDKNGTFMMTSDFVPAGNNTEVQFNTNGVFGSSVDLTFANDALTIGTVSGGNSTGYLRLANTTAGYYTEFHSSDTQAANVSYTFPTNKPGTGLNGFMKSNDAGVWSWDTGTYVPTGTALLLDQTTPQAVVNGSPIMEGIQFDTTPSTTNISEGLMRWNATDGTLDLGMSGGDITMQLGQEMFTKVRNDQGVGLVDGQVVYVSGRTGIYPDVRLARSDSDTTADVVGVVTSPIPDTGSKFGYVTTTGYVRGIKTNYSGLGIWGTTWMTGDKLYVSKTTAGQLTNVEPSSPHHSDIIGSVAVVHAAQGSILVSINYHKTLSELTDVNGTALTATGQIPVWNQTNGYFDFTSNISDFQSSNANLASLSGLTYASTSFVKMTGANTFTLDTTTYLPLAGGTLTGNLLFSIDNTIDIGAVAVTRPRTGYFGTSVVAPNFTGVASKATNMVGGNSTTLLGSIGYQSNTDTTSLLSPNTTTTKKYLTQTGTGTNGAAPIWDTILAIDVAPTLNDAWWQSYDYTGNIFSVVKISKENLITFGGQLDLNHFYHVTNAGVNNIVDIPITAASPDLTEHGVRIKLGVNSVFKISTLSDGVGGIKSTNTSVLVGNFTITAGHALFTADNTYDIGAVAATRPRTGYFGTSVVAPNFTGVASKATNMVGGNNTTLLGSIGYQSNTDTTTLLSPNITTTKKWLNQTGTGTNGAAPAWSAILMSDVSLLNNTWITTLDYAGNSANLIKLSADNIIEFGAPVGINSFYHVINPGVNDITDIQVSSDSTVGTEHGIGVTIAGIQLLRLSALSDGAGSISGQLMKWNCGKIEKLVTVTDTYQALSSDYTIVCNKATAFTVTLPVAVIGQILYIKNINTGVVTIDGLSTDTIDDVLTVALAQWECLTVQCNLANKWIIL